MIEARIKLAEAMGWERQLSDADFDGISISPAFKYINPNLGYKQSNVLPDPFTDANDDYALMVWARDSLPFDREQGPYHKDIFIENLPDFCTDYTVGDYARALCVSLDIQLSSRAESP